MKKLGCVLVVLAAVGCGDERREQQLADMTVRVDLLERELAATRLDLDLLRAQTSQAVNHHEVAYHPSRPRLSGPVCWSGDLLLQPAGFDGACNARWP